MAFWDFFTGTQSQINQLPKYTPEQQQAFSQLLSSGLAGLQNPEAGFQPIQQQAERNFQTNYIPSIAERFTSMGGGGQRSSAFQGALGQAGSDLASQLGALQAQYGLQNRSSLLNQIGYGLAPQFENYMTEGTPGLARSILPAIGTIGGSLIGGPLGGLIGGGLGSAAGGLFGGGGSGIKSLYGAQQQQGSPGMNMGYGGSSFSPQQLSQLRQVLGV